MGLFRFGPVLKRDLQDVDYKEKPDRHLLTALQRVRACGHEGYARTKTPRTPRRSQPAGDQGLDFTEVSRIREGTVCLAPLLLVLDQRGHPVPEGLPQPAPGGRASHPEEAPATGAKATCLPGPPLPGTPRAVTR